MNARIGLKQSKAVVALASTIGLVLTMATVALAVHGPNQVSIGRSLYRVAIANCSGPDDTGAGCNTTESVMPVWEDVGIPGNNEGIGDETSYGGPPIKASVPITIPKSTGRQLVEVELAMGSASCRTDAEDASGICLVHGALVAIPAAGPEIQLRPATMGSNYSIVAQGLEDWSVCPPDRCPRYGSYTMAGAAVLEPGQYTIVARTTLADVGDPPTAAPSGWLFGIDAWQLEVSQYLCGPSCG